MATLHGKGAVLYMSGASGDAAVQITEAAEFSIDIDFDTDPDPALGDTWETKLKGLLRASGSFTGNFDDAQDTIWDATVSTASSKFYLYPDSATSTRYYYGSIWPKFSLSGGTGSKIADTCTFESTGQFAKNPA